MSNKIQIDANDTRVNQAQTIVTAMVMKCPNPIDFQALVADLIQAVLDHSYVDEIAESAIRQDLAEIVGAEVINDDNIDAWL